MRTFLVIFSLAIFLSLGYSQTIDYAVNLATSNVASGYDADDVAITLVDASDFPDPALYGAYDIVWWNGTTYADPAKDPGVEIVRVTAKAGSVLTVTRAQQGTSATTKNTSGKTYRVNLPITARWMNSVRDSIRYAIANLSPSAQDSTWVMITADTTHTDVLEVVNGVIGDFVPISWGTYLLGAYGLEWKSLYAYVVATDTLISLDGADTVLMPGKDGTVALLSDLSGISGDSSWTSADADTMRIDSKLKMGLVVTPSTTGAFGLVYASSTDSLLYYKKPDGTIVSISPDTGASGLTSLNGLTGATQVFAVDSVAAGWGVSSVTSTHTLQFPGNRLVKYADTVSTMATQNDLTAKQNTISNLADTSKYVESTLTLTAGAGVLTIGDLSQNRTVAVDSANFKASASNTGLLSNLNWSTFNAKQAAISNLADTSKYAKYIDSSGSIFATKTWVNTNDGGAADSTYVKVSVDTVASLSGTRTVFEDTLEVDAVVGDAAVLVTGSGGFILKDSSGAIANSEFTESEVLTWADTITYIATQTDLLSITADSTYRTIGVDTLYALDAANKIFVNDSLSVLGNLSAPNLVTIGDTTGWAAADSSENVLSVHSGKIYKVEMPAGTGDLAWSDTTSTPGLATKNDLTSYALTVSLKQGAYLSDTTKFVGKADSTTYPGYATLTNLATKQATIANLADTSKYAETAQLGSSAYTDSTYHNALVDAKISKSDSATYPGYATLAALATKQATISNLADTAKYVEKIDSLSTFATPTLVQDSSAALRAAILSSNTSSAGTAAAYFFDDSASTIGGYNLMLRYPIVRTQEVDSGQVDSDNAALDTVLIESYVSPVAGIGTDQIDAGEWVFNMYAGTSSNTGTNSLRLQVYERRGSTETLLFSANTGDITGSALTLYQVRSIQPAFEATDTSRLVVKVYAFTISNTVSHYIFFSHNGSSAYSYIETPILYKHNELRGLQGGTTDAYFHLTETAGSAAYADSATYPGYATLTALATKQATVANLADTSKYVESTLTLTAGAGISTIGTLTQDRTIAADSANFKASASNTGFLSNLNWSTFNAKQGAIANLADTSKYIENIDSVAYPGYATLTALNGKASTSSLKQGAYLSDTTKFVGKADSATYPGYATLTNLATKIGTIKQRGTASDSVGLKSDFPRSQWSVTIDSSYINTSDTIIVSGPDYITVLDSIGVYGLNGAAFDIDIKTIYATAIPSWTAIKTAATTITSRTAKTWFLPADNATVPANAVIGILFSETTTKPKMITVHFVGHRTANGTTY